MRQLFSSIPSRQAKTPSLRLPAHIQGSSEAALLNIYGLEFSHACFLG